MDNKFLRKLDNADYNFLRLEILRTILDRSNAVEIIKTIFPSLTKREYLPNISSYLLEFLILHIEYFNNEILYLLKGKYISNDDLNSQNIQTIISNIPEAIDIIVEQFNDSDTDNTKNETPKLKSMELVNTLTNYIINKRLDLFEKFINAIINLKIPEAVNNFFVILVTNDQNFDYNLILSALRNCKKDENDKSFSDLPYNLAEYVHWSDSLKVFLVENFEELFAYEKSKKARFLFTMRNLIPKNILDKYAYILKISNASMYREDNEALKILLSHQKEEFIKDFIGDETVTPFNERMGTTSEVFKIGDDKILKIAQMKHDKDSEKEHFLLAPTKQLVIKDETGKPILYIEKQELLLKTHDGIEMNDEDLDNYFNELEKCDMELTDPHCLARDFHNFGFLKDYHDATLVGVSSHEELPEWFKKRPIVCFDIDMFRKKNIRENRKLG